MRIANCMAAVLFVLCAVVQFNDPDPWRWVLFYGSAAAICFLWDRHWVSTRVLALVGIVSLGGSGWVLAGSMSQGFRSSDGVQWAMTRQTEPIREGVGLLLVALWMGGLAVCREPDS